MTGYAAPEMELSSRSDLNRAKSSRSDPCRHPTGHPKWSRGASPPARRRSSSVDQTWRNCEVRRAASWAAHSGTAMVTLVLPGGRFLLASAAEVNDRYSYADSWRTLINPLRMGAAGHG